MLVWGRPGSLMVRLFFYHSGSGKTHLGRILAHRLSASLCDDYDPTMHGVVYSHLMETVHPTSLKPVGSFAVWTSLIVQVALLFGHL